MHLPLSLSSAIEELASGVKPSQLALFAERLSQKYRERSRRDEAPFIDSEGARLAYLAFRFPATYAAVSRVCEEVRLRAPNLKVESLLDVGAGPGTAMWAAQEHFRYLASATLLEKDRGWRSVGEALLRAASSCCSAVWVEADLQKGFEAGPHDLVLLSYSIGELPESVWTPLLEKFWAATRGALVVIEPGTPVGFERIRKIRELLLKWGGHMIAPCPHQDKCPMSDGDWCHFAQRVERTALHRRIKSAELGYEDEKFSYVAVGKQPAEPVSARILRHPIKNPGYVTFNLCTPEGLKTKTVSRKDKEAYRLARKAEWGDQLS